MIPADNNRPRCSHPWLSSPELKEITGNSLVVPSQGGGRTSVAQSHGQCGGRHVSLALLKTSFGSRSKKKVSDKESILFHERDATTEMGFDESLS